MPGPTDIGPPFDEDDARGKVQAAEDAWNRGTLPKTPWTFGPDRIAVRFEYESRPRPLAPRVVALPA